MCGMDPMRALRRTTTTWRSSASDHPVLLTGEPGRSAGFHGLRPRWTDRALARWQGCSLDGRLAAGRPPESERVLALRALRLVRLATRVKLARDWHHLLEVARDRPSAVDPRARLCRDRVLAAEPEIQRMLVVLRSCLPLPARGVAMANHLLTDAAGPVYNRRSPVDLRASLDLAVHHMDPATDLIPSA
jgi:hypothetical protein